MRAHRRGRGRAGWAWAELVPAGVAARVGLCLPLVGEVEGDQRRCEARGPEVALDAPGGDAGCAPMGSGGMAEGRAGTPCLRDAGALGGLTEGPLDPGAPQGRQGGRTGLGLAPGGGQEPRGVTRRVPVGAEPREGVCGPRAVPGLGALAAGDMALKTVAVHSGALQGKGCMEPPSSARDGGPGDWMVPRRGGREAPSARLHTEDGRKTGGLRTQER